MLNHELRVNIIIEAHKNKRYYRIRLTGSLYYYDSQAVKSWNILWLDNLLLRYNIMLLIRRHKVVNEINSRFLDKKEKMKNSTLYRKLKKK